MQLTFGIITLCIAAVSYSLYFRNTLQGRTRPHGITWFIWGMLNVFIWYEQMTHGAGPGAWVTAVTAFANLAIFILAFRYGERHITRFDMMCLLLAGGVLLLQAIVGDAAVTTVLASGVFVIGFLPTWRKSIRAAGEETSTTFLLNGIKFFIAFLALDTVSVVTATYPLVLFAANILFVVFLLWRRATSRVTPSAS